MSEPWVAEKIMTVDQARALVVDQFPQLGGLPVVALGEGWDNHAFLVGEWVFRFPRRAVAAPLIEFEARILPAIAPGLPLAIPVPRYLGLPTESYPWKFLGYARLPGRTATRARLDDGLRSGCAEAIGRFLAALHAIPTATLELPRDGWKKLDPVTVVPVVRERIQLIRRQGSHPDPARIEAALDALAADLRPAEAQTLVHGDLYASHLLVDEHGAAIGVIDWGDLHQGDRAVDLSFAHAFLPTGALERFRRAYGEIDEATWKLARFRALLHDVFEVGYAHDVGDADALAEAHGSLARLL
jgi:aminoglycoside phosphotransferase (APT) family kinase protein